MESTVEQPVGIIKHLQIVFDGLFSVLSSLIWQSKKYSQRLPSILLVPPIFFSQYFKYLIYKLSYYGFFGLWKKYYRHLPHFFQVGQMGNFLLNRSPNCQWNGQMCPQPFFPGLQSYDLKQISKLFNKAIPYLPRPQALAMYFKILIYCFYVLLKNTCNFFFSSVSSPSYKWFLFS